MNEKRKGEIALLFLKNKLQKDGIRLNQRAKREIGNTAKEIGVNTDEIMEFTEIITRELVDEIFPQKGSGFRDGVSCENT